MEYNSDTNETIIVSDDEQQPMDLGEAVSDIPPPINAENEAAVQDPQLEDDDPSSKVSEPEQTEPTQCNNESVYDDDGRTCPICLDSWTNFGEHRVCALKCGHLFGLCCILQWLAQKQRTCPTCKKKTAKSHIRHIYARKLVAVDTSEYENIKKQLDEINEKNNRLQIELTRGVCREHLLLQQVENLKKEVTNLNMKIEVHERFSQSQSEPRQTVRLYMDKSLKICNEAGCRVLDYYVKQDLIVASMKSPNVLFPGFGVRKINISTYKPTTFIPLHSKMIRDLSIHPQNPWLLSVSLDKTLKIVDVASNLPISGYTKGEAPLWACCWDLQNLNTLYVGSQQGSISKFDLRYMTEPVSVLDVPGDMSPVVSLEPLRIGGFITRGGVIVCKLNSLWVFANESDERLPIPMEGPFISMKYQNSTNHLLLSTRPNSQYPFSRHLLCTIEKGYESNLLCNIVHCFNGSPVQKYLSRSCFVEAISDSYVAAHEESSRRVFLWSTRGGQKVCSVPAHDPVLDLCSFSVGDSSFVVSLTETKLDFLKFA